MRTPTSWLRNTLGLDDYTRQSVNDHPELASIDSRYDDGQINDDIYLVEVSRIVDDVHGSLTILHIDDNGNVREAELIKLAGETC